MLFSRPLSGQSRSIANRARKSANKSNVELLEGRQLMSVSVGSDGYTDVVKSGDSKVIYVSSSSGSDSNSGLSEGAPVRSISKGISLMRSGSPDHVLLKRGDSWTETFSFGKSGRSQQEPALLGAYGSGSRPMIKAGGNTAIDVSAGSVNNVVIQGVHLFAHTRDPKIGGYVASNGGYGIRWVAGTTGVLIEDCVIDQFRFNLLFQPYNSSQSNVKLRRNVITDAYSSSGHASGMYVQGVNGVTLEENVVDHNGWNASAGGGQSPQNHNAYLSERNNNVVVRGNVFSDASSHGLQTRAGGVVQNNLFLRNPIHMSFGLVNGNPLKPGGVTGEVSGNVYMESRTISGGYRGWALELGNIKQATVRDNIFHDDTVGQMGAISLASGTNLTNASQGVGINNLTIENNIVHKWYMAVEISNTMKSGGTGTTAMNNLVVRNNDFQNVDGTYNRLIAHPTSMSTSAEKWSNNRYHDEASSDKWYFVGSNSMSLATWKSRLEPTAQQAKVTYANPNASIGGYAGSFDAFVSKARTIASGNFTSPAAGAINYVRNAFNRSGVSTSPTPTPTPTTPPSSSIDTTLPTVVSYTGTSTSVVIKFSENVKASLTAGDLTIRHTTKGTTVTGLTLSYDTATNTATWKWSYNGGRLSSGSWRVTLPDQNVLDAAGNRLGGGQDFIRTITV